MAATVRLGWPVVLVAHSQGNLMVAEALEALARDLDPIEPACVGVMSIAPPQRIPRGPGSPEVTDLIIEGTVTKDILLVAAGLMVDGGGSRLIGDTPRMPNGLSVALDGGAPWWSAVPVVREAYQIVTGIALHKINDSYLTDSGVGTVDDAYDAITQGLLTRARSVATQCVSPPAPIASIIVTPASASVSVGGSITLTANALSASGAEIPKAHVVWRSTNDAIARVSTTGVVTAIAPGGPVGITATVGDVTGQAWITVTAGTPDGILILQGRRGPGHGDYALYVLDPRPEGALQKIGDIRDAGGCSIDARDITLCPDGTLYAIGGASLFTIDPQTALAVRLEASSLGHGFYGLDCDASGQLYASGLRHLSRIDIDPVTRRVSGATLLTGAGHAFWNDIAFDRAGTLFAIAQDHTYGDYLLSFDQLVAGNGERVGGPDVQTGFESITGLAFYRGDLYAVTHDRETTGHGGYIPGSWGYLLKIDIRSGMATKIRDLPFRSHGAATPPRDR